MSTWRSANWRLTGLGCWVLQDGEGFRPCLGVTLAEGAADDT
jgi:hypothetical protein